MKPNLFRWLPQLLGLALLLGGLTGCNTVAVQPWQRAKLAEYGMRADRDPLASALGEHIYFSRESIGGGRSVGGGGCGCN